VESQSLLAVAVQSIQTELIQFLALSHLWVAVKAAVLVAVQVVVVLSTLQAVQELQHKGLTVVQDLLMELFLVAVAAAAQVSQAVLRLRIKVAMVVMVSHRASLEVQ
jgi:hypothetical protein